ncbi:MAG: DUF4040 domain-containing protein [Candidatus Marinimicrobia bacterium]|nr:DUF4040 domain-containing protein [Candidatus Neomarinimicrobiota bacterium]
MITLFIVVLGIIMIMAALMAIYQKNLLSAIVASGVISLLASVIYILLAAPDVAMTEAAIGSGLTTIVFLYTLNKINKIKAKK